MRSAGKIKHKVHAQQTQYWLWVRKFQTVLILNFFEWLKPQLHKFYENNSPAVFGLLQCKDRFSSDRPSRVHPHCRRLHGERGFPHQVMISFVIQDHFKSIILRFVYYETLVTSMKSLGVREPVISYDDLKVQRLSCFMTLQSCSKNRQVKTRKTFFMGITFACCKVNMPLLHLISGWMCEKASVWLCGKC